jgi:hypothetical protein
MIAGLVVASLLAASPAPAALPFDDKRFELHVGGRGGGRFIGSQTAAPASFGGGLSLGLGVRLWQGLYFEAAIGEGVYQNPSSAEATESFRHIGSAPAPATTTTESSDASPDTSPLLVGKILLGARYEVRTARTLRVRPSVFLGVTHLHEATLAGFADSPGKTIAGTGKSIQHRTGVEAGVGLRVPFPERWGAVAPRFSARFDVDFAYYFDTYPGRVQAGLGAGLQVVF